MVKFKSPYNVYHPTAKMVEIMLDKPRHLLLDFNALAMIEEKTGKNAFKAETWQDLSARDTRILIWACLLHEDLDLTIEQAGAMLNMSNIAEITAALGQAMTNSFPDAAGDAGKNAENLPIG